MNKKRINDLEAKLSDNISLAEELDILEELEKLYSEKSYVNYRISNVVSKEIIEA